MYTALFSFLDLPFPFFLPCLMSFFALIFLLATDSFLIFLFRSASVQLQHQFLEFIFSFRITNYWFIMFQHVSTCPLFWCFFFLFFSLPFNIPLSFRFFFFSPWLIFFSLPCFPFSLTNYSLFPFFLSSLPFLSPSINLYSFLSFCPSLCISHLFSFKFTHTQTPISATMRALMRAPVEYLNEAPVTHACKALWARIEKKHRINSYLINHCPASSGVSEVSERANK